MLKNIEGQRVPDVTFHTRVGHEWKKLNSNDVFKGKKVVVFGLPGAFTPTCSSTHAPRYRELLPAFQAQGVDSVVCVSVNDAFVMNEWAKDRHATGLTFLPDGNGEFTAGMNMLVDKSPHGLGKRSRRYSMLVDDGVVKKMFVEAETEGDPLQVSDADTMLRHLNPKARPPRDVVMFSRPGCTHCAKAMHLLREQGWECEEIPSSPRNLRAVSGKSTTPQIFIDGKHIGGTDELKTWLSIEPR